MTWFLSNLFLLSKEETTRELLLEFFVEQHHSRNLLQLFEDWFYDGRDDKLIWSNGDGAIGNNFLDHIEFIHLLQESIHRISFFIIFLVWRFIINVCYWLECSGLWLYTTNGIWLEYDLSQKIQNLHLLSDKNHKIFWALCFNSILHIHFHLLLDDLICLCLHFLDLNLFLPIHHFSLVHVSKESDQICNEIENQDEGSKACKLNEEQDSDEEIGLWSLIE